MVKPNPYKRINKVKCRHCGDYYNKLKQEECCIYKHRRNSHGHYLIVVKKKGIIQENY